MKTVNILLPLISLIGIIGLTGCSNQATNIQEGEYKVDQSDMVNIHTIIGATTGELTEVEKTGLIKMREEEKLARDVYTVLGEKRGNQIFNNIAKSEQTHTDAIKGLLEIYGIEDPVKSNDIGVFNSEDMKNLYTQLIVKGNESILSALIVGATIEDLDIKDLNELLKETTNENVIAVYNNLNKGSRNHMRAFIKNITKYDGSYSPQYISSDELNDILSSSQETGSGRGRNQK